MIFFVSRAVYQSVSWGGGSVVVGGFLSEDPPPDLAITDCLVFPLPWRGEVFLPEMRFRCTFRENPLCPSGISPLAKGEILGWWVDGLTCGVGGNELRMFCTIMQ
jgi:hypothetical protein